jgi:signal transduction histidine kinase
VEDLLFLARSESGTVSLPQTSVHLADVLTEVAPALQALAETAGIACTVAASPALWVQGNASLLFRLIFNLGENAIKYTPVGGTVTVVLSQHGREATLEVRDTGPGIAPEEQGRIFDRFYRGDPARGRGGTGLGLALARSIALVHNGRITVESVVGQGSCFRVALPLVPPATGSTG